MISIRENIFIKFTEGVSVNRMELEIDAASELPEPDFLDGILLYQGSIAHDISTGDFYSMDSEGTWYKQDGSGAYVPEEEDEEDEEDEEESEPETLNSPLNIEHLNPHDLTGDILHSEEVLPAGEPTEVIISDDPEINDVPDNNDEETVEEITEAEEPVEFTEENEAEETGETMEEILGNELSALDEEETISDNLADEESISEESAEEESINEAAEPDDISEVSE
ncbi:MAG: hypothetical protein J6Y64_02175 [Ruminococcus sp.]|nr:hypothetical protein [Ruminococcus sp.]